MVCVFAHEAARIVPFIMKRLLAYRLLTATIAMIYFLFYQYLFDGDYIDTLAFIKQAEILYYRHGAISLDKYSSYAE